MLHFSILPEVGLSGTGRLHDLFVNIEGMTPGEYKNGGQALHINYSFAATPFGRVMVASTDRESAIPLLWIKGRRRRSVL